MITWIGVKQMADYGRYYRAYRYMQELLKSDFTHNYIKSALADGDKGEDTLVGKTSEKVIDMDWVVAIEETLPYIQKAIDEQRRFIKQVENVVRIEKAKKIGTESVKHLAQHTSYIAKVEGDMVTPNRILTIEREESFAIYENRVLMTLIHKALHFVDDKYSKLKGVPNDSYNNLTVVRKVELNRQKLDFNFNYINESHEVLADDLDVADLSALSDFDRIRRIRSTLNEFLATPLMREISKEPQVRPPITQTNLLKKNPNFKKAMDLWNFLDSYKKQGFEIASEEYNGTLGDEIKQEVYFCLSFEHFVLSMAMNPGLRKMLDEKYEEENARLAEKANKPERDREKVVQARIDAVRKEEMELRLSEIRDRERKILELNAEIKNLKNLITQKDQQILTLKGELSALKDVLEAAKEELKQVKLELLAAQQEIERLNEENEQLKARVAELEARVSELEQIVSEQQSTIAQLEQRVAQLEAENTAQKQEIERQRELIAQQKEAIDSLNAQLYSLKAEHEQCVKERNALREKTAEQESLISQQSEAITTLTDEKTELNTRLEQEVEAHAQELSAQKQAYEQSLAQQQSEYEQKFQQSSDEYRQKLSAMEKSCEVRIEAKALDCEARINKANSDNESKLLQLRVSHDREKQQLNEISAKQLDSQKKLYEQRLASVTKEKDKAYSVEERKFTSKLQKLQRQLEHDYDKKLKQVKSECAREISAAKKRAKEEIRQIKIKARRKMFTKEEIEEIHKS